jgi:hypothetical protein
MWKQTLTRFWRDEDGFLVVTDWVVVASILLLGAAVGLAAARNAVLAEAEAAPAAISSR